MRSHIIRFALLAAAALPLTACAIQYNARNLGVPVTMAEPAGLPVPGDTFNVSAKAVHLFWGVVPARQPSLQQSLAGQLGAGAGVHSLVITSQKKPTDVFFTIVTLGIISPTSVTFRGVIAPARP